MRLRGKMSEEGRRARGRRRRVHADREESSDPGDEASVSLPPVLYLSDRVASLFRDGVSERRRSDVSHSKVRPISGSARAVLRRRDLVRIEFSAQKGHRLPRSQIGQRTTRL